MEARWLLDECGPLEDTKAPDRGREAVEREGGGGKGGGGTRGRQV